MGSPVMTPRLRQRSQENYDPTTEFVPDLRFENWTDADFETFVSPECAQLRAFVLNNLVSRRR